MAARRSFFLCQRSPPPPVMSLPRRHHLPVTRRQHAARTSGTPGARSFTDRQRIGDQSIVIAGGGVIGSAVAFFVSHALRERGGAEAKGWQVTVVERDPTYRFSSTALSASSIRHQFSTRENVLIGQYGSEFLRNTERHLDVDGGKRDHVNVNFKENGYLFLASPQGRAVLESNHKLQRELGSSIDFLGSSDSLTAKFPYLHTDDLAAGCFGARGEGWFDPTTLLNGFKDKAKSLGVHYVHGEVVGTELESTGSKQRVKGVVISEKRQHRTLPCTHLVNAMGPQAARLSAMMGLTLPVVPRKRCVFVIKCRDEEVNKADMPLVIDPSGVYWRPENGRFITGVSPLVDPDAHEDFDVDHDLFDEAIWPVLAHRVPAFEAIKVESAWAGHYDYNTFDQNAIVGAHPFVINYYHANGFSGHGLQQSPAVGRAVSELMLEGRYLTLDLSIFRYERILENQPVFERNVV